MPATAKALPDEHLLRVLRTAPRSTTYQLRGYIAEDYGVALDEHALRTTLDRLYEAGVVGRHDRRDNSPHEKRRSPHYTWWVLDGK